MVRLLFLIFLMISCSFNADSRCLTGNCLNGKGKYLFSDGSQYSGTFMNGKLHGFGTVRYKNGNSYTGDFARGVMQGSGSFEFASGNKYEGNFHNGKMEGTGTMCYHNGDKYSGEWKHNHMSGKGTYTFTNGVNYVGYFLNSMMHGTGKLIFKDGAILEGEWVKNLKHGNFVFTDTRGVSDVQNYENDVIKNRTTLSIPDIVDAGKAESVHISYKDINCNAVFCHNITGNMTFSEGTVYHGFFRNGKPDGFGTAHFRNGKKYEGQWKNGHPEGEGTYSYASGKIVKGMWREGQLEKMVKQAGNTEIRNEQYDPINTKDENNPIKVYALIAGVATYNHMPSLKYTDDDAYRFYAFLKSPEGGALEDHQIKLMIDESATRKQITEALSQISRKADHNDVLIIYLSGHGLDGAFLPYDFTGSDQLLTYESVMQILNECKAGSKLLIADACHSGSIAYNTRSVAAGTIQHYYQSFSKSTGGTAMLVSSAQDEVSLEYGGLRQGIFSHFLIRGIRGEADSNKDKIVDVTELHTYISLNVKAYTAGKQSPQLFGSHDGKMPVAAVR
jgi:hypothetical protein